MKSGTDRRLHGDRIRKALPIEGVLPLWASANAIRTVGTAGANFVTSAGVVTAWVATFTGQYWKNQIFIIFLTTHIEQLPKEMAAL